MRAVSYHAAAVSPILTLLLFIAAPCGPCEPTSCRVIGQAPHTDDKPLKALDAWQKSYRAGKIDVRSQQDVGKDSIAGKYGLLPKGVVGSITAQRELAILLELAVKLDSVLGVAAVLEVAAIGLDQSKVPYTIDMAPFLVRAIGEQWLNKCTGSVAIDYLGKAGRGELKWDKTIAASMRAAALRFQGTRKLAADRALLERNLSAPELPIRIACAEALCRLADEASVPSLALALDLETSDAVAPLITQAMHACFAKYLVEPIAANEPNAAAKPPAKQLPESAQIAAQAVIKAIGKTTWRADMAHLQFLSDFRTKDAIPALINVLQRFKDHPEDIQSGNLSGLLLHRAHDTLVSMTGAILPADAPEKWRALWEKDRATIVVAPREQAKPANKADTVAGSFCGIPVQGSRVLFIVDLSGSMGFPMKSAQAEVGDNRVGARIDFAKKQLHKVIGEIPEASRFNFITYNGNPKAEIWNKDLLPANSKNKAKAIEFVNQMRADGGTNMWSGLETGLKMKSMVYGERYGVTVDELFLVSDGAPSAGDIQDPAEILQLVTETNQFSKVRINTIFITSESDRDPPSLSLKPSDLMRLLATQNGGKFVEYKN
ncbi:hypothetical protein LBMAG49_28250 [Planctomycetota bacterium]|nr:hypothetical protein LBMAG49_28250 [Planctomycetota bacterium]